MHLLLISRFASVNFSGKVMAKSYLFFKLCFDSKKNATKRIIIFFNVFFIGLFDIIRLLFSFEIISFLFFIVCGFAFFFLLVSDAQEKTKL